MACKQHPQAPEVEVTSPSRTWRECWKCVTDRAEAAGVGYVAHRDGKELWRFDPLISRTTDKAGAASL